MTTLTRHRVHLTAPLLEDSRLAEQLALEQEAVTEGVRRCRELARQAIERGDGAGLKPAERLLAHWYPRVQGAIVARQRKYAAANPGVPLPIPAGAMLLLPASVLASLALYRAMSLLMQDEFGIRLRTVSYEIGRDVLAEANFRQLKLTHKEACDELRRKWKRLTGRTIQAFVKGTLEDPLVSIKLALCIGAELWGIIQDECTERIDGDDVPAFGIVTRRIATKAGSSSTKFAIAHEHVYDLLREGQKSRELMRPRYLPMIVEPYPWSKDADGGYVRIRTPLYAQPRGRQREFMARADLSAVYECHHAASSTPLAINDRVARVVADLWDQGGAVVGIPPRADAEKPARPDDPEQIPKWKRECVAVHRLNIARRAERVILLQKLAVADRFRKYPKFWLPYQFDFRGRLYPIPQPLNWHGDDLCRGLLQMGEPKPLTARGLWWIKAHAADCWGADKVPASEKVEWTDRNLDRLLLAGSRPLDDLWWAEAKKPWQFLSACIALAFPDEYGSRLVVEQDGTCSGLQHYVGLSRDPEGAALVNMVGNERPADLYSAVRDRVAAVVRLDAEAGDQVAARLLPMIDRDLVKQTTMTTFYGVTAYGARGQIRARLKERGIAGQELYEAMQYLPQIVTESIGNTCPGARRVMDWLSSVALAVAKLGEPMRWTTPLGFPVVQPYHRLSNTTVNTALGQFRLRAPLSNLPVRVAKQVAAWPPNFIHSLDGTHLMLTALVCGDSGVGLLHRHDADGTHAVDVDDMGRMLRVQFISLYLDDHLVELHRQVSTAFPGINIETPPIRGDYDIQQVAQSPAFFS